MNCPHCHISILIESVNCGIFRCGVYKHNGEPIDPHTPEEVSKRLVEEKKIYGCGLPFMYLNGNLVKSAWI
jgi:hypothetical protein